jgi:glycine C-acetyltransferase
MTVPDVAACIEAVDILQESTQLVDKLWANADLFRRGMQEMGFDTGHSETPDRAGDAGGRAAGPAVQPQAL